MKIVAACLLALAASTVHAATPRVELAHQLYRGCILGTLASKSPPETQAGLTELIKDTDEWCMEWMGAWYVVAEDQDLSFAEMNRFTEQRMLIKAQIQDELKPYLKKK